jgi:hypothetical protein
VLLGRIGPALVTLLVRLSLDAGHRFAVEAGQPFAQEVPNAVHPRTYGLRRDAEDLCDFAIGHT